MSFHKTWYNGMRNIVLLQKHYFKNGDSVTETQRLISQPWPCHGGVPDRKLGENFKSAASTTNNCGGSVNMVRTSMNVERVRAVTQVPRGRSEDNRLHFKSVKRPYFEY